MSKQVGEKTPGAQWRVGALWGLWPLVVAAVWAWFRDDAAGGLWWVGLFLLLQFAAAATYLARSGRDRVVPEAGG